jgi:hypothetical protein
MLLHLCYLWASFEFSQQLVCTAVAFSAFLVFVLLLFETLSYHTASLKYSHLFVFFLAQAFSLYTLFSHF